MIRQFLLATILIVLTYGFWVSPNFKEISAGVAIFLFGMLSLEDGFKAFTGGLLEKLLKLTTDKLWKSLSFGVVSTALMQSSTLVSMITISFLSAGLISLAAGIGIIFGANLGTTTGAWLVATLGLKVDIAAYAMPMIVFGVIFLFQKNKALKGIGYVLAGIGFLFLGIHYMKDGFEAFKSHINLTDYTMTGYRGVLVFVFVGMVATVIMQSSHATLVLILTALAAQQISYENALALAIGANLGTAISSLIGAIGANVDGRRLVVAHLIFNLLTATVAVVFIFQLMTAVDYIAVWLSIAEDNYTLKLAIFHSLFNTIGILLTLPFISQLEHFLQNLLKARTRTIAQPRHLFQSSTTLSDTAIEAVRLETVHLYDNAFDIITGGLRLFPEEVRSEQSLAHIIKNSQRPEIDIDSQYNNNIKGLYSSIIEYISTALPDMSGQQADDLFAFRAAGRDIVEAIKSTKHLQKNLSRYEGTTNPYLREEYDLLRLELAECLRELEVIRKSDDDEPLILSLDNLRLRMKENDKALTRRLEARVRDKKIDAEQATSLMNDSSYAYEMTKNLVKMGEVLFSAESTELKAAEHELKLEDTELDDLLLKE